MRSYQLPIKYKEMVRAVCEHRFCSACPFNDSYDDVVPCPYDFTPENVESIYNLVFKRKIKNITEDDIMRVLNGNIT